MAWFSKKTEDKNESEVLQNSDSSESKKAKSTAITELKADDDVLKKPHISEKSFSLSQNNVYTFEVVYSANKYQVIQAIKSLYNVTPKKVRIIRQQPRKERSLLRNRTSHNAGLKKAYVYLNKGDTINFM